MSRAIDGHRGHVAKFIGDGILALFGALESNPWQTNDAVHAALAMRAALAEYNATLTADGVRPSPWGSESIAARGRGRDRQRGADGVRSHRQYVNVASRVERLTRTHGVDVLVTDAVRERLDRRFHLRAMPAAEVRGLPARSRRSPSRGSRSRPSADGSSHRGQRQVALRAPALIGDQLVQSNGRLPRMAGRRYMPTKHCSAVELSPKLTVCPVLLMYVHVARTSSP